eukprot:SAG11_NODE_35930_length_264_cov_0.909091_1_plen_64_part_01
MTAPLTSGFAFGSGKAVHEVAAVAATAPKPSPFSFGSTTASKPDNGAREDQGKDMEDSAADGTH